MFFQLCQTSNLRQNCLSTFDFLQSYIHTLKKRDLNFLRSVISYQYLLLTVDLKSWEFKQSTGWQKTLTCLVGPPWLPHPGVAYLNEGVTEFDAWRTVVTRLLKSHNHSNAYLSLNIGFKDHLWGWRNNLPLTRSTDFPLVLSSLLKNNIYKKPIRNLTGRAFYTIVCYRF